MDNSDFLPLEDESHDVSYGLFFGCFSYERAKKAHAMVAMPQMAKAVGMTCVPAMLNMPPNSPLAVAMPMSIPFCCRERTDERQLDATLFAMSDRTQVITPK